ncbi:MAG: hypothetical protein KC502_16305 [Myxococcales bacterium]|nr:hypothetical protein [Myxococcales bacterium]
MTVHSRIGLPFVVAFAAMVSACGNSGGGGGGGGPVPCSDNSQCFGYVCSNGFCDFTIPAGDAQGDSGSLQDTGSTTPQDTGGTTTQDTGGTTTQDTGGTTTQDTYTPPQDAGCKTASGKPCCTSDSQCSTGSSCTKGTCDQGSGECKITTLPNCCQKDSDCSAGSNPCKTGSCNVATKVCTMVDAENGDACDDGNPCTEKDNCVVGSCNGQPKNCDDGDICTSDSCSGGQCKNDYKQGCCAKGECCDVGKQSFKAQGSQCGTKPKTELRCSTDKSAVETRFAFPVCDGKAGSCPTGSSAYSWSNWAPVKSCGSYGTCENNDGAFDCVLKTTSTSSCSSGVCCDTAVGKIKPKTSKCGTTPYGSKRFCVGNNVFQATGYKGCSGSSYSSCYTSSSYRHWTPAVFYQACAQGQYCYVSSSTSAYCKSGIKCSSGACCDVKGTGAQLPKYTPCGTTPIKTEYTCGEGNKVMKREALPGCSGSSTTCSTSTSYAKWSAWKVEKTCASTESCQIKDGKGICGTYAAPKQCTSGVCCDTTTKRFKPSGTKCGTSYKSSRYRCSADYKKVLRERSYYGCNGRSSSCSTYSTYYAWTPSTYKTCSSGQYCKQTSSSSTPYCSSSPSKCSSGTCCDSNTKYYKPKYTACSTTVKSTHYKCGQSGEVIYKRIRTYGCTGASYSCSSSSSYYTWTEWKEYKKCTGNTHCTNPSSSSASCSTFTPGT